MNLRLLLIVLALWPLQLVHAQNTRNQEWAVPVDQSVNFFQVSPTFFRSAQFGDDNLEILRTHGIKTVVSLRAFHSDEELLKDSGIKNVRVAFYTWDIDDEEVIEALRALRAAERDGPVLLHCLHGADRTGLVTAMYRIVYQSWDRERAIDELQNGGYGYHSMWTNVPRYLRNVDVEKIRKGVERTELARKKD